MQTEVDALKFLLQQNPNGTILSSAQSIRTRALSAVRIYWLDQNIATPEHIKEVNSMQGVKSFEIIDVSMTIYDPDWKYEDNYINQLFLPLLEQS